jgi:hypothetical protein
MFALTFLVALVLLVWRTQEGTKRDKARVVQLQNDIQSLEVRLWLKRPALHQAILNTHDEYEPIRVLRDRSISQFDVIRQKYSTMESRGAEVLSIRGIPSLQVGAESAPIIYRLLVPAESSPWLKFGVYLVDRTANRSRPPGDDFDFLPDSPFEETGPFETRLPAGDQRLEIVIGAAKEGSLPILITLDEVVLLRSSFISEDVSGVSSSRLTAASQLDFGRRGNLPSLLNGRMSLRTSDSQTHAFVVWLSDQTSNFASFPGE